MSVVQLRHCVADASLVLREITTTPLGRTAGGSGIDPFVGKTVNLTVPKMSRPDNVFLDVYTG